MSDGKFYLGQLRHAYKQAVDGVIGDQQGYAAYLLGPAVAKAEEVWEQRDGLIKALQHIVEYASAQHANGYVHQRAIAALEAIGVPARNDSSSTQSKEPK